MWSITYLPPSYGGLYWPVVGPHTISPVVDTSSAAGCDESLAQKPASSTLSFPAIGESRSALGSAVGGFWTDLYGGQAFIRSYLSALETAWLSVNSRISDATKILSRQDIPPFEVASGRMVTWKRSECTLCDQATLKFNQGATFGGENSGYLYDVPVSSPYYAYELPDNWRNVLFLADRITSPTRIFTRGIDFWIDQENNWVVFLVDPFEDVRIPKEEVFENGEIVDTQIRLWAHSADIEHYWLRDHYGYVVKFNEESSENYKKALNALFDCVTQGTSWSRVLGFLSAIFDIPVVINDSEIVEEIASDNYGQFVATDKAVYRFPFSATINVSVGQTVYKGDSLISQFSFADFGKGEVPDWLPALALDKSILSSNFLGELTFVNKDLPLVVEENVNGYTKVSTALGGFPLDVDLFWEITHDRGISAGRTLAHALDIRPNPTDEPTAVNLPSTINPLKLLVENFLRNNVAVVGIHFDGIGPNHLDFSHLRHLYRLIPPHIFLAVIITASTYQDSQLLGDGSGGELSSFDAGDPISDSYTFDDSTKFDAWSISGTCQ